MGELFLCETLSDTYEGFLFFLLFVELIEIADPLAFERSYLDRLTPCLESSLACWRLKDDLLWEDFSLGLSGLCDFKYVLNFCSFFFWRSICFKKSIWLLSGWLSRLFSGEWDFFFGAELALFGAVVVLRRVWRTLTSGPRRSSKGCYAIFRFFIAISFFRSVTFDKILLLLKLEMGDSISSVRCLLAMWVGVRNDTFLVLEVDFCIDR